MLDKQPFVVWHCSSIVQTKPEPKWGLCKRERKRRVSNCIRQKRAPHLPALERAAGEGKGYPLALPLNLLCYRKTATYRYLNFLMLLLLRLGYWWECVCTATACLGLTDIPGPQWESFPLLLVSKSSTDSLQHRNAYEDTLTNLTRTCTTVRLASAVSLQR